MERKSFKILSIDGGGIKGLYSAAVLSRLEEKSGAKAADCFDMICGTSTGGLIALGIACGKNASEMVDLYYKYGNEIFPTSNWQFLRFFQRNVYRQSRQTLFWGKFSNAPLKNRLVETFGERKLGELDNLVCIPSFNLISGMPRVFKFPHKEGGFFMDKEIPIVDAALATSAAPTYFPIHEYNKVLYVDGGVWANNPSLCGLLEALDYFVGDGKEYQTVELLSIPSVTQATGWPTNVRRNRSFWGWKSKLFQTSMDGQAYFTHFFLNKVMKKIIPDAVYTRIEPPKLSATHMSVIEMDRADKKALDTLKVLGDQDGYTNANRPEVIGFFNSSKTYKTR